MGSKYLFVRRTPLHRRLLVWSLTAVVLAVVLSFMNKVDTKNWGLASVPAESAASRVDGVEGTRHGNHASDELAPVNSPSTEVASKPEPGTLLASGSNNDPGPSVAAGTGTENAVSAAASGHQSDALAKDAALDEAGLRQALKLWSDAWRARDLKTYLSMYDDNFLPSNGLGRQAWAETRSVRISAKEKIDLSLQNLRLQITGNKATVKFTQVYSDERLSMTDNKTMLWQKRHDRWLIQREITD